MLPLGLTAEALAAAAAEPDPDSLAAATRMRRRFDPDLAAAALTQVALRRRAAAKFGDRAGTLFFTRDGLEQATRPAVAAHHAGRFRSAGVGRVVDLGCGIGSDALAFAGTGLEVVAVERDARTAEVARANLAGRARVDQADAERAVAARLATAGPATGWFVDPSRRDASGRIWRTGDFSPGWEFVLGLLSADRVVGVKLGPALPHAQIPAGVEAEWVTHAGTTVEVGLWSGPGARTGARRATVLAGDPAVTASLLVQRPPPPLPVAPVGRYLYEPAGAVIRAGAIGLLGAHLGATLLEAKTAFLSAAHYQATPFATAFEVLDSFGYAEASLRRWIRAHRVGAVEIKVRGLDIDPAPLRRRLGPRGPESATIVLTRTPAGARVLHVTRIAAAR